MSAVIQIVLLTTTQFVEFCVQYSSLTLVYYDYLLTLNREIKYVWRRKFHVLTIMYFFCRYSTVANVIFAFGLINKLHGLSCDTAYTVSSALSVLGRIGILSVLGVRTCALFQNHRALIGMFAAMGLLIVSLAVAHVPYVSCTGSKIKESRIATDLLCVMTVVYEMFATALLAFGCYRSIRMVGTCKEQKNSLMFLMLKEGFLYTGFVTAFTTTAMVLNYAAPLGSFWQRLLNALTIPISGLMTARFVLHVREWQDRDLHFGGSDSRRPARSPLQFNFEDGPSPKNQRRSLGKSSEASSSSSSSIEGAEIETITDYELSLCEGESSGGRVEGQQHSRSQGSIV